MATSSPDSKKRLALAIIDFLSSSLKDGTVSSEDAESIDVAQQCIADAFHVDPKDQKAVQDALGGGQSLLSIYGVYEKLKGKSTASTAGASSAGEGRPSTPSMPKAGAGAGAAKPPPNPEAEAFKSQGNAAMQSKDYKTAIDMYSKALNISPLNPIYLSNRAAAYSAASQHTEASTDAEMAVAADPKYTKAWSRLGLARFALGDAKGSMEAYQKGIEFEGSGGSEAMKKGYETAKRRVEEEEAREAGGQAGEEGARGGGGSGGGGAGPGGMPDLSSLAGMFGGGGAGRGGGGGGGTDLSSIMNNPMFASMAQNLMSNPEMMNNIMSNPRLREMAQNFGGGGGGGGGGGMPDLGSLMQDPSIAEMARNMMGGGRGGGRGGGGAPDRVSLYALDNKPLFWQHMDDPLVPHLRVVHSFPQCFQRVGIDRGAIRFVLSGATLMAPGLTSKGGRLPGDGEAEIEAGEVVVIEAEGKEEACLVGQLKMGTAEIKDKKKGIVMDAGHYLGDGLWKMSID